MEVGGRVGVWSGGLVGVSGWMSGGCVGVEVGWVCRGGGRVRGGGGGGRVRGVLGGGWVGVSVVYDGWVCRGWRLYIGWVC